MSDTKAIRPEIKGLFDTIRQQAVQYAESFEKLEKSQSEYEILLDKTKKIQNDFTKSVKAEIFNFRESFTELTETLKIEQTRISQTYSELKDLKYLQNNYSESLKSIENINKSLKEQNEELKRYYEEYQKLVNNLQESTREILDKYVNNANEQIDSLIKQNLVEFDKKVSVKVRELERKITDYDKSIGSEYTNSTYNIKVLLSEVSAIKETIKKIGGRNLQNLDKVNLIDSINNKLDKFDEKFAQVNKKIDNIKNSNNLKSGAYDESNLKSNELAQISLLKKEIADLEKKHNLALGVGVCALLISVVGITLAFMI